MSAIEFENVYFSYGDGKDADDMREGDDGRNVLRGVSFVVEESEFVALVGNNGSGKSTIVSMIDAFLAPDAGRVTVLGCDIGSIAGTDDVFDLRRNVGFVFQNPDDQIAAQIVMDEVAFGPCNLGLPRAEVIARVDEALANVGMTDAVGRDVNTLSGGQKQRITIADALAMRPKLLILDEPTSMLDPQGRRDVMGIIERAHANGTTVLLVTHDPEEAALADRVMCMENGRVREDGAAQTRELRGRDHAHKATLEHYHKLEKYKSNKRAAPLRMIPSSERSIETPPRENPIGTSLEQPIIRFENVAFCYGVNDSLSVDIFGGARNEGPVLEDINLEICEGELLAIAGPNGSGKTTLIQHMNGLLKPTSGSVVVDGVSTSDKAGAHHARHTVGVSFQYPERSLFAQTVYEDIAFGPRNLGLSAEEVDERVHEAMADVALDFGQFAQRSPFDLSGGEQRKVAIAGVIAMRPQVLVLDEPCASMDAPTHEHFVELFLRMKAAGQTIVIVTHDERDIELLADRAYRLLDNKKSRRR